MNALRQELIKEWLNQLPGQPCLTDTLQSASSDASFRRYFRVARTDGAGHLIVMDAPPPQEDVRPFIRVNQLLRQAGIHAPEILAENAELGFLLLEDLGNLTLLQALEEDRSRGDAIYRQAMSLLVKMQANVDASSLPAYSAEKLRAEMDLFDDWFVKAHCKMELTAQEQQWLDNIKALCIESALSEGQVFVHRDYHSRNLMLPQGVQPELDFGVIDFQDAVKGPITYDLVSILRDAYIEWPEDETLDWAIRFWEQARKQGLPVPEDASVFYRQVDFMGLQRHIKILGIFARLNYRDGKAQYLDDLHQVLAYVRVAAGRYSATKPLIYILDKLEGRGIEVGYTF